MRSLLITLAAFCCVQQAAAINKCVNDEGDVITYSDTPCSAESQPVNSRENTVRRETADKQRLQKEQAQSQQRETELRREHASQYDHAVRVKNLAEAEERERAARNAQVGPIVPRTPTAQNPYAPPPAPITPGSTWYR